MAFHSPTRAVSLSCAQQDQSATHRASSGWIYMSSMYFN